MTNKRKGGKKERRKGDRKLVRHPSSSRLRWKKKGPSAGGLEAEKWFEWTACCTEQRLFQDAFGQCFRSIVDLRKTAFPRTPAGPHVLRSIHRPAAAEKLARPTAAATVFGTLLYMEERPICAADGYMWGRRKAVVLRSDCGARENELERNPPVLAFGVPGGRRVIDASSPPRLQYSFATVEFGPTYRLDLEKMLRALYDPNSVASATGLYTMQNLLRRESIRWSKPMRYWLHRIWVAARTKRRVVVGDQPSGALDSAACESLSGNNLKPSALRHANSTSRRSSYPSDDLQAEGKRHASGLPSLVWHTCAAATSTALVPTRPCSIGGAPQRVMEHSGVDPPTAPGEFAAFGTGPQRDAIDRDEYMAMHHMMCLALGHCDTKGNVDSEMKMVALVDWNTDSGGHGLLDHHRFTQCWFQLADQHTEEIDEAKYVEFVKEMSAKLTIQDSQCKGRLRWRTFDEIVARNRRKQRERVRQKEILRLRLEHSAKRIQGAWVAYCERLYYEDCALRGIAYPDNLVPKTGGGGEVDSPGRRPGDMPGCTTKTAADEVVPGELDGVLLAQLIAPQVGGVGADDGSHDEITPPATPFEALFRDLHAGVAGVGVDQYGVACGFNSHRLQMSPTRTFSDAPFILLDGNGFKTAGGIPPPSEFDGGVSLESPPMPPSPISRNTVNLFAPPPKAPPPPMSMDASKSWSKAVAIDVIQTSWRSWRSRRIAQRSRHQDGAAPYVLHLACRTLDTSPYTNARRDHSTGSLIRPAPSMTSAAYRVAERIASPPVAVLAQHQCQWRKDHREDGQNPPNTTNTASPLTRDFEGSVDMGYAQRAGDVPSLTSIAARATTHYRCAIGSSARPLMPDARAVHARLGDTGTGLREYADHFDLKEEAMGLPTVHVLLDARKAEAGAMCLERAASTTKCNEILLQQQWPQFEAPHGRYRHDLDGAVPDLSRIDAVKDGHDAESSTEDTNAAATSCAFVHEQNDTTALAELMSSSESEYKNDGNNEDGLLIGEGIAACAVDGSSDGEDAARTLHILQVRRHMAARRIQVWARTAHLVHHYARCTTFGGIRRAAKNSGTAKAKPSCAESYHVPPYRNSGNGNGEKFNLPRCANPDFSTTRLQQGQGVQEKKNEEETFLCSDHPVPIQELSPATCPPREKQGDISSVTWSNDQVALLRKGEIAGARCCEGGSCGAGDAAKKAVVFDVRFGEPGKLTQRIRDRVQRCRVHEKERTDEKHLKALGAALVGIKQRVAVATGVV